MANKKVIEKSPIEKANAVLLQAVADWERTNTPEALRERVIELLNSKRDEAILKIIGFDNRWGRWEISSKDINPISMTIQRAVEEAVPLLGDIAQNLKFSPSLKNRLIKEATVQFEDSVSGAIYRNTQRLIEAKVEEELKVLASSEELNKIIQLRSVIKGKQSENDDPEGL